MKNVFKKIFDKKNLHHGSPLKLKDLNLND